MSTTKKRIYISISSDIEKILDKISKRDKIPEATIVASLLNVALEIEEDEIWNSLAGKRDTKNAKFIAHKNVWA